MKEEKKEGWRGESEGKCKNSLWGDKETSKEEQNEKRYEKEMGLKH